MPWHTLSPASKIRIGEVRPFIIAGRLLAIGRTATAYFAVDGICPHAGANLGEGEVERECVICPVHGYAYDVHSGEGQDDGAHVRVHRVELEGDTLRIELPD